MVSIHDMTGVALTGIGATLFLDAWLWLLRQCGVATMNLALLGRWLGHGLRGRWRHASLAQARPVAAERALGWLAHYAIGVAFAAVLVLGLDWLRQPRAWPALAFGVATVAAPLFVMQPATGAGFAARRTPAPLRNCLRSLVNHAVFGIGLFLAACLWSHAVA